MSYVITEACVGMQNAQCLAVCPVDCIYPGDDQYFINPDECIGCGACEPECPVNAIYPVDGVPPELASFIAQADAFFGR